MTIRSRALVHHVVCLGCALGMLSAMPGCYQQTTYPAIPTARGFTENPNTPAGEQAIVASLQYVASRYAPGNREYDAQQTPAGAPMVPYEMAVNLPIGTRKMFYERIPTQIGPHVVPLTQGALDSKLPVFHISRIWLRHNTGTVDVIRPMAELGPSANGQPIYQKVTLRLEREFGHQWRVVYGRAWTPGADTPPELYFVPATDNPNQYAVEMRARGLSETGEVSEAAMNADHAAMGAPVQTQPQEAAPEAPVAGADENQSDGN